MSTVTTTTTSSIADIEGWCVYADVLYGDNGDPEGVPNYDCGTNSDNAFGYIQWGDPDSGIDSGNVAVSLNVPPGGGSSATTWNVEGGASGQLTYTGVGHGAIQSIKIVAGVQASGCKMSWNGLVVEFYKSGSLIESITIPLADNPVADAMSGGTSAPVEQVTTITPTNSNNDQVIITGTVRLQTGAGVYPGEDDIFGDIFVYTSGCSG